MSFLFAFSGRAQEARNTATITGQVVDQQGGVLQDAKAILLNTEAVRLQDTTTGQNGDFAFRNLVPDEYVVEVQRSGFVQAEKRVAFASGQAEAHVSIRMEIAGPGQQVTATSEVSSFRTDESSIATKMNIP